MSAREQLIDAAKHCLVEKGWGATTVRDIAARAGGNHAAIGYYFGSREALLTHALVEAIEDLDREVARATEGRSREARWQALLDTVTTHRALWLAQLEAIAQADRSPEVRAVLAEGQRRGREGLGGAVPLAVLVGLAVQSVVDGEDPPPAADVLAALRARRG